MEEEIKQIKNELKAHFADDKSSFDKIYELMTINGDHMSHFRKDSLEIKEILKKQNEEYEKDREVNRLHRERIEPMISSYESDMTFKKILNEKRKKWGGYVVWIAGILGAWYVIKDFIKAIIR